MTDQPIERVVFETEHGKVYAPWGGNTLWCELEKLHNGVPEQFAIDMAREIERLRAANHKLYESLTEIAMQMHPKLNTCKVCFDMTKRACTMLMEVDNANHPGGDRE